MRWKAGKLLTVPLRGMRMTDEMLELYSGNMSRRIQVSRELNVLVQLKPL